MVWPKVYQSNLREAPVATQEGEPSDDSKIMVTGTPVLHEAPRVEADVSPPSGDPPAAEHDVLEEKVVEDDSPTNWGKQGQEGQEASRWAVAVKSGAVLGRRGPSRRTRRPPSTWARSGAAPTSTAAC